MTRLVVFLAAGLLYSTANAQVPVPAACRQTSNVPIMTASVQATSLRTGSQGDFLSFTKTTKAQLAPGLFSRGDLLISPGISFSVIGYGGYQGASSGFLPLSASLEYSLDEKFAIGPYVGFYSRSYDFGTISYKVSSVSFGAKGTLHATGLINDAFDTDIEIDQWDIYTSAYLGLRTYGYGGDNNYFKYPNRTALRLGLTIGGRYFFNPNVGVFLELGYGVFGASTLGVSFRL